MPYVMTMLYTQQLILRAGMFVECSIVRFCTMCTCSLHVHAFVRRWEDMWSTTVVLVDRLDRFTNLNCHNSQIFTVRQSEVTPNHLS